MLECDHQIQQPPRTGCSSPCFARAAVSQAQIAKPATQGLRRVPTAPKLTQNRVELVELSGLNLAPEILAKYQTLIEKVNRGLAYGLLPQLCEEGEGGTYFLYDERGEKVAVFKPEDEEIDSPSNPKRNNSVESLITARSGLSAGTGAVREVAAYLLDHGGFAGVPTTALVKFHGFHDNVAVGSLQEFVPCTVESWDISFSRFPREDVHQIGLLDVRLFNTDRHGGNVLVKEPGSRLVPIDHGLCLPPIESALANVWFEWLNWPQTSMAFGEKETAYVEALDEDKDAAILRALGIGERVVTTLALGTRLLKWGVRRGATLHQLGVLVSRPALDKLSPLEQLMRELPSPDSLTDDLLDSALQSASAECRLHV